MNPGEKCYLGDAIYAKNDGHGIELTTEDGIRATNVIYLEPDVIVALLRILGSMYDRTTLHNAIDNK